MAERRTRPVRTIEPALLGDLSQIPMRLEPVPVARVWGGDRLLREIHPRLQVPGPDPIGETWEVSDVGDDPALHSRVAEGPAAGFTLRDLLQQSPRLFLGEKYASTPDPRLPLLYKFIHAEQNLSVQVHPSDELLGELGIVGLGKSEAWVILDAEDDAEIIYGLEDGVTYEEFMERAQSRHGIEGLRRVRVRRGDVINLPAGTVHAIGAGILLAEIQQSSDITYRIYDWGRVGLDGRPRQLHLEEASRVRPPEHLPPCPLARAASTNGQCSRIAGPHFTLDEIRLHGGSLQVERTNPAFGILSVLEGEGTVLGSPDLAIRPGDTLFIPAALDLLRIQAAGEFWGLWMQPAD